jgi:hypothetical protein
MRYDCVVQGLPVAESAHHPAGLEHSAATSRTQYMQTGTQCQSKPAAANNNIVLRPFLQDWMPAVVALIAHHDQNIIASANWC